MNILQHALYWFKAKPSGLSKLSQDERDFNLGIFGWFDYKPKHDKHIIPLVSVKNQYPINNCVFQTTTAQKEYDEQVELSARSLTIKAKEMGLVSGDGFSDLRSGQKVLKDWGIMKQNQLGEGTMVWSKYSTAQLNDEKASEHKTQSFWRVNNKSEVYKLLDESRPITIGMQWYTGFNQGGGFKSPWLITKPVGFSVGGHAVLVHGYINNYYGHDVFVIRNSYGNNWGDAGDFYVDADFVMRYIKAWGAYVNLDLPKNSAKIVIEYDGQNVKGSVEKSIYYIQKGKKYRYPNWEVYMRLNKDNPEYHVVVQHELDDVPNGETLT